MKTKIQLIIYSTLINLLIACSASKESSIDKYKLVGDDNKIRLSEYISIDSNSSTGIGKYSYYKNGIPIASGEYERKNETTYIITEKDDSIRKFLIADVYLSKFYLKDTSFTEKYISSLLGIETVFAKNKSGNWEVVKKATYSNKAAHELDNEVNHFNDDYRYGVEYPEKAAIGEVFYIRKGNLKHLFARKSKVDYIEMKQKLIDVIERNGHPFAILDCSLKYSINKKNGNHKIKIVMNVAGRVEKSLVYFEDFLIDLKGTYQISESWKQEKNTIVLKIEFPYRKLSITQPVNYNEQMKLFSTQTR